MKIINLIYIYFITNIQSRRLYSCRSQHSLTCVSLDFPINGFYEITNCDLLKNTFNSFVVEHNFFCNNMNQTYKEVSREVEMEYPNVVGDPQAYFYEMKKKEPERFERLFYEENWTKPFSKTLYTILFELKISGKIK